MANEGPSVMHVGFDSKYQATDIHVQRTSQISMQLHGVDLEAWNMAPEG